MLEYEPTHSPLPGWTERRGNLKVTVGERRVVMRVPMFPVLAHFGDGSVILIAASD